MSSDSGVAQLSVRVFWASVLLPLILLVAVLLLIAGLGALYLYCCLCTLRGELDLITDEETGKPLNVAFFKNPFKKQRKKDAVELVEVQ